MVVKLCKKNTFQWFKKLNHFLSIKYVINDNDYYQIYNVSPILPNVLKLIWGEGSGVKGNKDDPIIRVCVSFLMLVNDDDLNLRFFGCCCCCCCCWRSSISIQPSSDKVKPKPL